MNNIFPMHYNLTPTNNNDGVLDKKLGELMSRIVLQGKTEKDATNIVGSAIDFLVGNKEISPIPKYDECAYLKQKWVFQDAKVLEGHLEAMGLLGFVL